MGKDALQHKSFIAPQIRICTQLYELKIKDKICSPNYSLLFLVISHGKLNCIGGVMVSVLASSVVDCAFEPRSGQTTDYKIVICFFSTKHVTLRRKSKEWLAQNQDNVSE
jgi:hypothetical protein